MSTLVFALGEYVHGNQSRWILLCLCSTLLCLYITFIIIITLDGYPDVSEVDIGLCGFLSGLLQFFFISSLAWIGLESLDIYFSVSSSSIPRFMVKAGLVAWGIPGLIVILTGAVARRNYVTSDYCFLQFWPSVCGLLIPALLIILFTLVTFTLSVYQLKRSGELVIKQGDNTSPRGRVIGRLKDVFCISTLIIMSWVVGYINLIEPTVFGIQVLFITLNFLQGFFFLILYCSFRSVPLWQTIPCLRSCQEEQAVPYGNMREDTPSDGGRTPASPANNKDTGNQVFQSEVQTTSLSL
ncbi:adhesion G-protein coupled receptor G6-like [Lytechinus variegatus]|uniref:adhesion G-protein coupled receptor G6-like n=1 Tax=Lytechinus variegatus TaxID=7654 RepID=UPI001BB196B5|nr:adhesion G-protein coupled receptor G6-like [Lytechinus variegatus]